MKGLLLKDYYLIGSVLWILLAAMAVIGIAMAGPGGDCHGDAGDGLGLHH